MPVCSNLGIKPSDLAPQTQDKQLLVPPGSAALNCDPFQGALPLPSSPCKIHPPPQGPELTVALSQQGLPVLAAPPPRSRVPFLGPWQELPDSRNCSSASVLGALGHARRSSCLFLLPFPHLSSPRSRPTQPPC